MCIYISGQVVVQPQSLIVMDCVSAGQLRKLLDGLAATRQHNFDCVTLLIPHSVQCAYPYPGQAGTACRREAHDQLAGIASLGWKTQAQRQH